MTNEEKRNIVLSGNLYMGLFLLSIPIIINNLMQTAYNFADTLFVSMISSGSDIEVGAVGGVWPITALIIAFGAGLQIAGTSLMSQHIGANNKKQADKLASQLFLFAFILGIIMMTVGIVSIPYILDFMNVSPEVKGLSTNYLRILFLEMPIVFTLLIFSSMRQAYGDTVTPVIFTGISVLLNIGLDPLFIFVFKLGVEGVAIATVLSKLVVVPFWLYMTFFDKDSIHVTINKMKLQVNTLKQIVTVMMPASIGQAFSSVGFIVLNSFIFSYGDATMAAFTIGNSITNIVMMPAMGFGSALAFYVGQNIGNNNYKRAREAFRTSLVLTLSFMIIGMIVILPYPVRLYIIKLFLSEKTTIKLALEYMIFVGINIPLMGLFQNYIGIFQGAGKTKYSFIMFIIRLWGIRIPLILFLKNYTDFGSTGIWYAMVFSNIIVCLIGFLFYKFGHWEKRLV